MRGERDIVSPEHATGVHRLERVKRVSLGEAPGPVAWPRRGPRAPRRHWEVVGSPWHRPDPRLPPCRGQPFQSQWQYPDPRCRLNRNGNTLTPVLLLLAVLACRTVACAGLTGLARDACLADQVRSSTSAAEVQRIAPTVRDAVVRDAVLIRWVDAHRADIEPAEGEALCALLTRQEGNACLRKLSSAHLSP